MPLLEREETGFHRPVCDFHYPYRSRVGKALAAGTGRIEVEDIVVILQVLLMAVTEDDDAGPVSIVADNSISARGEDVGHVDVRSANGDEEGFGKG